MSKKIALIQGGLGSEREVSRVTGQGFASALQELGLSFEVVEADAQLPGKLQELKPDVALLAVHGKYAEDGTVQGICEYLKIPYTGSGVLSSALCMDKLLAKKIFGYEGIPTPGHQLVDAQSAGLEQVKLELPLPVIVKPSRDGSSVAVERVFESKDFLPALKTAAQYDRYILVEQMIEGKEITIPLLGGVALPSIEIEPKSEFYNYDNKYTAGKTNYYIPARLESETLQKCADYALKAAEALRTRVYCRVDFMLDAQNNPYVLEVNTLPGCTPTSLLPKSASHHGIEFPQLVKTLIESADLDYAGLS